MARVRPIKRFVLLFDDPEWSVDSGVSVHTSLTSRYLDYYVAGVGTDEHVEFGSGDRVVLSDPNAGRKVRLDGVACRVVRVSDIIAVVE